MAPTKHAEVPVISIQCDWNETLRHLKGEAWVSCKFRGQPSHHGKLYSQGLKDGIPSVSASDDFCIDDISKYTVQIRHIPTGSHCIFVAPDKAFVGVHAKSVISTDATPNGLCVSACTDDKLQIWDAKDGVVRRSLDGHVGNVYRCRFFPSGVVVLSGGADMQLKIWSAETGQCPVTLSGHKAAITDFCIVERGRNVISVSKDGSAKLWDCGMSNCLGDIIVVNTVINCCSLGVAHSFDTGNPEKPPSEREVGTNDKVLILGCEDGAVHIVAVWSRKKIASLTLPSAVNCVSVLNDYCCVVGCQDGQILLLKITESPELVHQWYESNSAVLSLLPYKERGFFVGKADGSCTYYHFPPSHDKGRIQLTGPDCDPVYDIAFDGTHIYTASRDAAIRKYSVSKIINITY